MGSMIRIFLLGMSTLAFALAGANDEDMSEARDMYPPIMENFELHEATEPLTMTTGPNSYDEINELFLHGSPVTFEQFKGIYAGRCFVINNKNKAENVAYGYLDRIVPADEFQDPRHERRVVAVVNLSQPADFFDHQTVEQIQEAVKGALTSTIMFGSEPQMEHSLTYYYASSPTGKMNTRYEIRASGNMLIERMTALYAMKMMNPWTKQTYNASIDQDTMICYMIKK